MRQLELKIQDKLKQDFPREIAVLEDAMDILAMYGELLRDQTPFNKPTDTPNDLLKANAKDRCLTAQIMLVIHATEILKASRLLLLTGYISSAMSCLRTSYEALDNAHICSIVDEQAIRFFTGNYIDVKINVPAPDQLKDEVAKDIKRALSNVGVHPNYKSLETQGYFDASIFDTKHRNTYEFCFLRSLWTFFTVQLYLLAYLVEKWPNLMKEIPNVVQAASDLRKMIDSTQQGFMQRAKQ